MNKSFTLIEILVVIVVVGIISSFILVGMSSITNSANIAKSKAFSNSLRNSLLMNLVSEWKFDGNVVDSWGNNSGTLVGTPTYELSSDCVEGQCIELNGTTDYVTLTSATSLAADFTITAWIFRDTKNTYDMFLGMLGSSMKIGLYSGTDKLFIRIVDGGNADGSNSDDVLINKWNYVVIVRDVNNKIDSYVNTNVSRRLFADIAQSGTFQLDRIGICTEHYFDGKIDNISIYNKQMSVSFLNANYYVGLNKLLLSSNINIQEFSQRLSEFSNSLANN